MAMSVPLPMAIPTSALASAGASLIPSPTIATTLPSRCRDRMASSFCSGRSPATKRSIPTSLAIAAAVRWLSPVSIITWTPIAFSESTAAFAEGFNASETATMPPTLPSATTTIAVFPCSSNLAVRSLSVDRSTPFSSISRLFPKQDRLPVNARPGALPGDGFELARVGQSDGPPGRLVDHGLTERML